MRKSSPGAVKLTPNQQNKPISRILLQTMPFLPSPILPTFHPISPFLSVSFSDDQSNSYHQSQLMGSCSACSIFIALVFGIVFLSVFQASAATVVVGVFFLSYAVIGICYHACRGCLTPNQPPPVPIRQPLFQQHHYYEPYREPPSDPHAANNFNHSEQFPQENEEVFRETFNQAECTVCFDAFGPTDVIARLNCGHKFHQNCIVDWLERQLNCPNCRKPLA